MFIGYSRQYITQQVVTFRSNLFFRTFSPFLSHESQDTFTFKEKFSEFYGRIWFIKLENRYEHVFKSNCNHFRG